MLPKLLIAAAVWALVLPATASAKTLTTIETPSVNVDPSKVKFNGSDHPRRLLANVLLPDGYDGKRRFPVLYLLHGAGDSYRSWMEPERGDILQTAKDLDAIVVMPEGDTGFYSNWWNGGRRGDPGWERFYLDELIPLVEKRYRVLPGRRWHAAAGLSMGGFGATFLATQLPSYFGSSATFSGFIQHQRPQAVQGLRLVAGVAYEDIFGPVGEFYATGHNPTRLVDNLRATRLYVTVGNGVSDQDTEPGPITAGAAAEAELSEQAKEFVAAARGAGVDTTYVPLNGVHSWPYWRRHLRDAIAWDLFRPVPEAPLSWTYGTVAQQGEAWGLRYSFAAPPSEVVTFTRAGERLRGAGSGTVTVRNAARCGFTVTLPFERSLPARTCGRLAVAVRPRRLRLGRVTKLRLRVTRRVGSERLPVSRARVSIGRRAVRTNPRGRATLRYRPRGRPGVRRLRVRAAGLRPIAKRLRAVRLSRAR